MRIISSVCCEQDFYSDWYKRWQKEIAKGLDGFDVAQITNFVPVVDSLRGKLLHRKSWEWCTIAQALFERGMLTEGKLGMGFAVGAEPLSSLFARYGAQITATDSSGGKFAKLWQKTGQLATSMDSVWWPGLIDAKKRDELISFRDVDMHSIKNIPHNKFDFIWSSCSIEHLGSLKAGLNFVIHAMDVLKPGGIAIHTTEYNISSNEATLENKSCVIYRERDIIDLARQLRKKKSAIENLSFNLGCLPHDINYDYPPYFTHGLQHITLELSGFITTSMVLVIRKG